MSREFQIIGLRKCEGSDRNIKGYADVQVGPIGILGIKIIEIDGKTFCGMPSEDFFSKSAGRTLSRAIVHVDEDLKAKIYGEILERWYHLEQLKFRKTEAKINDNLQN